MHNCDEIKAKCAAGQVREGGSRKGDGRGRRSETAENVEGVAHGRHANELTLAEVREGEGEAKVGGKWTGWTGWEGRWQGTASG